MSTKNLRLFFTAGLASAILFAIGCETEQMGEASDGIEAVVPITGDTRSASSIQTDSVQGKLDGEAAPEFVHGIHNETMILTSGETLRYTIAIPKVYDGNTPTSLIVGLHYGGEVSPHYAAGLVKTLVAPGLEKLRSIIIAPDSLGGAWNNDQNEAAIMELMDATIKKYNIAVNKTLLTGFSMGGHGVWHIGSRHQDRFSALIPIAGAPMVDEGVEWTTPIYAIHSRADKVVPIGRTEKYMETLAQVDGLNAVFVVVDDLPHFETGQFATPLKDAIPWVQEIWATDGD